MYSPINDIHTVSTFSSYFPSDRRREVLLIHFILVRYWGHNLARPQMIRDEVGFLDVFTVPVHQRLTLRSE